MDNKIIKILIVLTFLFGCQLNSEEEEPVNSEIPTPAPIISSHSNEHHTDCIEAGDECWLVTIDFSNSTTSHPTLGSSNIKYFVYFAYSASDEKTLLSNEGHSDKQVQFLALPIFMKGDYVYFQIKATWTEEDVLHSDDLENSIWSDWSDEYVVKVR